MSVCVRERENQLWREPGAELERKKKNRKREGSEQVGKEKKDKQI